MIADILIVGLVAGYGAFVVYKRHKKMKERGCGCSGCFEGHCSCSCIRRQKIKCEEKNKGIMYDKRKTDFDSNVDSQ